MHRKLQRCHIPIGNTYYITLQRVKSKNLLHPFYYSNSPWGVEGFYALPVDLGDRVLDFGGFGFYGLFVV